MCSSRESGNVLLRYWMCWYMYDIVEEHTKRVDDWELIVYKITTPAGCAHKKSCTQNLSNIELQ